MIAVKIHERRLRIDMDRFAQRLRIDTGLDVETEYQKPAYRIRVGSNVQTVVGKQYAGEGIKLVKVGELKRILLNGI